MIHLKKYKMIFAHVDGFDYVYQDNGVINMTQVSKLCHTIQILNNTALEYTETLMFFLTTDDPGVKITGNTTVIVINEDPIDGRVPSHAIIDF